MSPDPHDSHEDLGSLCHTLQTVFTMYRTYSTKQYEDNLTHTQRSQFNRNTVKTLTALYYIVYEMDLLARARHAHCDSP